MSGVYAVFWREMRILRQRLPKTIISFCVSPLLFLIAFGWGVGRNLTVQGTNYMHFMIPGLMALGSMNNSFNIATEINIARFYLRSFERLQVAPLSPWQIVLGEVLSGMVKGLLAGGTIYLLTLAFGIRPHLSLLLWLSVLANTFMFASAAVITAMVVKSHADQASFNTFFITPMSFLAGTFFPLARLPEWAQYLARALPLTHASNCIRAAALGQRFPVDSFAVMIIYSAFFFLMAVVTVRHASI
ncbi:MAG: ABC transporter permease [Firmicutes bacterium]|nr:ABC transporter permease [Bacillota bacterium]